MEELQEKNKTVGKKAGSPLGDKTTLFSGLLFTLIGGAITAFYAIFVFPCFISEGPGCHPFIYILPATWIFMVLGPIMLVFGVTLLVIWRKMKINKIDTSGKL